MTSKAKYKNWHFFFTLVVDDTTGSLRVDLETCSSSHQDTYLVLQGP